MISWLNCLSSCHNLSNSGWSYVIKKQNIFRVIKSFVWMVIFISVLIPQIQLAKYLFSLKTQYIWAYWCILISLALQIHCGIIALIVAYFLISVLLILYIFMLAIHVCHNVDKKPPTYTPKLQCFCHALCFMTIYLFVFAPVLNIIFNTENVTWCVVRSCNLWEIGIDCLEFLLFRKIYSHIWSHFYLHKTKLISPHLFSLHKQAYIIFSSYLY